MFDEEPEDLHGECALEIARLNSEIKNLKAKQEGLVLVPAWLLDHYEKARKRLSEIEPGKWGRDAITKAKEER